MTTPPLSRIRIHSHVGSTHFLHAEDATAIGKIRLFAGTYRAGSGATFLLHHFVDIADMRVLCHALISGARDYRYIEYKGTLVDATHATSRVFRLHTRREEVWLELMSGPGTLTPKGTIVPNAQERDRLMRVQIPLTWHVAQAFAHAITAFLSAWDVVRAWHYRAHWDTVPDYALYTTPDTEPEVITYPDPEGLPTDVAPPPSLLHTTYGDGATVAPTTEEFAAFHAYLRQKKQIPPSRAALLRWTRARRAPTTKKSTPP